MNAHTPDKHFVVGQIWRERKPCPEGNLIRIEAITDHPTMPVIGRSKAGGGSLVDCYRRDGRCQDFSDLCEFDLVEMIEDVAGFEWDRDLESGQ